MRGVSHKFYVAYKRFKDECCSSKNGSISKRVENKFVPKKKAVSESLTKNNEGISQLYHQKMRAQ